MNEKVKQEKRRRTVESLVLGQQRENAARRGALELLEQRVDRLLPRLHVVDVDRAGRNLTRDSNAITFSVATTKHVALGRRR